MGGICHAESHYNSFYVIHADFQLREELYNMRNWKLQDMERDLQEIDYMVHNCENLKYQDLRYIL